MRAKSTIVLASGFGILIVLIAGLGVGAIQRASVMYSELQTSQDSYLQIEALCRGIATDMYSAGVLVRDYLLDSNPVNVSVHQEELIEKRSTIQRQMDQLSAQISPIERPRLVRLQAEAEAYWDSLDPIFGWSASEKAERAAGFLSRNVLPHRDAVVNLARELAVINNNTLGEERRGLKESQESLHAFLVQMTGLAIILGILVAALITYRVFVLERIHARQTTEIEETRNDLRRLSQRLVQLQEVERHALSRELHDEIGQTLTALGIQLGNLESMRDADDETFHRFLEELKRLNADAMRNIRDLAMGLRPSMLDDIGLEAALLWQGREFSRHTSVPSEVHVEGSLDSLTEEQRTCIYRVVQEALTNCARHARARNVLVAVSADEGSVTVTVQDDGVGFNSETSIRGSLGLLGMRERIQALDGILTISSVPQNGTTINVKLPIGIPA